MSKLTVVLLVLSSLAVLTSALETLAGSDAPAYRLLIANACWFLAVLSLAGKEARS